MLISLSFFVMMGQFLSASIPPLIGEIVQDLHVSSTKASQLTSWAVLGIGFGVWR